MVSEEASQAIQRVLRATSPWEALGIETPDPAPDKYMALENPELIAVVRKAYISLCRLIHPDRCSHDKANEACQAASQARDVILQGEKRKRKTKTEQTPDEERWTDKNKNKVLKKLYKKEAVCIRAHIKAERQVERLAETVEHLNDSFYAARRRLVRNTFSAYRVGESLAAASRAGVQINIRRVGAITGTNLTTWCLAGVDERRTLSVVEELKRSTSLRQPRVTWWERWQRMTQPSAPHSFRNDHFSPRSTHFLTAYSYRTPDGAAKQMCEARLHVRQTEYALKLSERALFAAQVAADFAWKELEDASAAIDTVSTRSSKPKRGGDTGFWGDGRSH